MIIHCDNWYEHCIYVYIERDVLMLSWPSNQSANHAILVNIKEFIVYSSNLKKWNQYIELTRDLGFVILGWS